MMHLPREGSSVRCRATGEKRTAEQMPAVGLHAQDGRFIETDGTRILSGPAGT